MEGIHPHPLYTTGTVLLLISCCPLAIVCCVHEVLFRKINRSREYPFLIGNKLLEFQSEVLSHRSLGRNSGPWDTVSFIHPQALHWAIRHIVLTRENRYVGKLDWHRRGSDVKPLLPLLAYPCPPDFPSQFLRADCQHILPFLFSLFPFLLAMFLLVLFFFFSFFFRPPLFFLFFFSTVFVGPIGTWYGATLVCKSRLMPPTVVDSFRSHTSSFRYDWNQLYRGGWGETAGYAQDSRQPIGCPRTLLANSYHSSAHSMWQYHTRGKR